MESRTLQTSKDGKTRIRITSIGLTVDCLNDYGNWVTMDVEDYGTDNIDRRFEALSGDEAEIYDEDRLMVSVEKVGGYMLHMETAVNLFKIDISCMPDSDNAIEEIFSSKTGHYVAHMGIEGCPGRWYTSRIEVVHVDDVYNYALIEVWRSLDV